VLDQTKATELFAALAERHNALLDVQHVRDDDQDRVRIAVSVEFRHMTPDEVADAVRVAKAHGAKAVDKGKAGYLVFV